MSFKKSLQALQNDGLASCLESSLLAPSHYCPLLTNNMDFPDNSYLAEILFKTKPSINFFSKTIGEQGLSEPVRVTLPTTLLRMHRPVPCQPVSPVRVSALAVNVTIGRTLAHK